MERNPLRVRHLSRSPSPPPALPAGPPAAGAALAGLDLSTVDLRATLAGFYGKHRPEQLTKLDSILRDFAGHELHLLQELQAKYDVSIEEYLVPSEHGDAGKVLDRLANLAKRAVQAAAPQLEAEDPPRQNHEIPATAQEEGKAPSALGIGGADAPAAPASTQEQRIAELRARLRESEAARGAALRRAGAAEESAATLKAQMQGKHAQLSAALRTQHALRTHLAALLKLRAAEQPPSPPPSPRRHCPASASEQGAPSAGEAAGEAPRREEGSKALQLALRACEEQLAAERGAAEGLRRRLDEAESDGARLRGELERCARDLREARERRSQLEEELSGAEYRAAARGAELLEAEGGAEELRGRIEALERELRDRDVRLGAALRARVDMEESFRRHRAGVNDAARRLVSGAEEAAAMAAEDGYSAAAQLCEAFAPAVRRREEALRAEVAALQHQVREERARSADRDAEARRLRAELRRAAAKIVELDVQLRGGGAGE